MNDRPRFLFHTFNRRGLGHLMRGLNIAREMLHDSADADILFYTRGQPLTRELDLNVRFFLEADKQQAASWPDVIRSFDPDVVVFDTMLPKQSEVPLVSNCRTAYIMRNCQASRQQEIFADPFLSTVDHIIVPHSKAEFGFDVPWQLASKTEFVGAIVRLPRDSGRDRLTAAYGLTATDFVLVSTPGGGGFQDEATRFLDIVQHVHDELKTEIPRLRHIVIPGPNYLGPTPSADGMIVVASEPDLVSLISSCSLVISAGGYNTVHEIRATKTPAVFLPSPRSHDDQLERVTALSNAGLAFTFPEQDPVQTAQQIAAICKDPDGLAGIRDRYADDQLQIGNRAAAQILLGMVQA